MPTHDCAKCNATDRCGIKDIASWLNDHEEEVKQAMLEEELPLATSCTGFSMAFPLALMCKDDVLDLVMEVFCLGYHKGRTYPVVPEVFNEV